jgi:hypothetical protein
LAFCYGCSVEKSPSTQKETNQAYSIALNSSKNVPVLRVGAISVPPDPLAHELQLGAPNRPIARILYANSAQDGIRLLSFDAEISKGATVYGSVRWEGDIAVEARGIGHLDLPFYAVPLTLAQRSVDAGTPFQIIKWRIAYYDGQGIFRTAYSKR